MIMKYGGMNVKYGGEHVDNLPSKGKHIPQTDMTILLPEENHNHHLLADHSYMCLLSVGLSVIAKI